MKHEGVEGMGYVRLGGKRLSLEGESQDFLLSKHSYFPHFTAGRRKADPGPVQTAPWSTAAPIMPMMKGQLQVADWTQ